MPLTVGENEVVESRKRAVSIRMASMDLRKVKRLAQRLGVRDSDVIRYAVKTMLARLAPLHDAEARGRDLVPAVVDSGAELLRYFDLDAARLETLINDGATGSDAVDHNDIALLALAGSQAGYAVLKLQELNRSGPPVPDAEPAQALRQYLYDKYVYRVNGGSHD